ncbi:hypothetical protein BG004_006735 [Podila humilis]|nr:hypothetical protein BG004_006735 [Podila humilis]
MTQTATASAQGSTPSNFNFTLTSISFSHYNEKVRWAMDYYGIPYIEYRSLPILHVLSMLKHKAKSRPESGTPFVTPHLTITPSSATAAVEDNKVAINESSDIIGLLSDRFSAPPNMPDSSATSKPALNLYSNNSDTRSKIETLEGRFDKIIGPNVRRYFYGEVLLYSPSSVFRSCGQNGNAGPLQTWIWTWFTFFFAAVMKKYFRVTPESAARSKDILKREFEHLSRVLESGPPGPAYLVGNDFSAADLTLASLAAITVGISHEHGYGAWVPPISEMRPEAQEFCKELRATTAGQHILECYRMHRGQKVEGTRYGYSFFGWW